MFLKSKVKPVCGADNLMSRLSRQCGILNISQPYRPPRPATWIALPFSLVFSKHNSMPYLFIETHTKVHLIGFGSVAQSYEAKAVALGRGTLNRRYKLCISQRLYASGSQRAIQISAL
jgi:hypothetical protein